MRSAGRTSGKSQYMMPMADGNQSRKMMQRATPSQRCTKMSARFTFLILANSQFPTAIPNASIGIWDLGFRFHAILAGTEVQRLPQRIPGTASGGVGMPSRPFAIVESASAAVRLARASAFLERFPAHQPITVVAATRGAADDLARRVASRRGATIGISRFSLTQLAARVAATRLAGAGIAPSTLLGVEAVASRVAFDASEDGSLDYFGVVARSPGFPRALARTLVDVRLAGLTAATLTRAGRAGHDLAALVAQAEAELANAAAADRAALLAAAAAGAAEDVFLRAPLLL